MKIYAEQLGRQLGQVFPAYLVCGDDPLIIHESCEQIRTRVLSAGNVERLNFHYDAEFAWHTLFQQIQELSLFSPLKLLEIHLEKSLDKTAHEQLHTLTQSLHTDVCILLITPQLKKTQQKQKWYQWIEQNGLIVQAMTPQGEQLKRWVSQRLQHYQLSPSDALAARLIYYYEGNLTALNQVIEQLHLIYPDGQTDLPTVEQTLTESGQFSQYQLVDTLWEGDLARAQQIAKQIRQQGDELTLFNWLLDKDLKVMLQLKLGADEGHLWKHYKIWHKRQTLLKKATLRLSLAQLKAARVQLAALDTSIKSLHSDESWREFIQLILIFASPLWGTLPCSNPNFT
ncbi:DNA polymerase III subunit delta [Celerinatantimonas yamalensis]|uniref:DNA polymerase III subunit delta n=1 Tax=Celerinatantimonas yamalensis TaxID=559956 RepID=A0ABW9G9F0_9GAMM